MFYSEILILPIFQLPPHHLLGPDGLESVTFFYLKLINIDAFVFGVQISCNSNRVMNIFGLDDARYIRHQPVVTILEQKHKVGL